MRRKRSKMNVYHVMVRGVDKNVLFFEDADRRKYLEYIKKGLEEVNVSIYGICLMGNHAHIMIGVNNETGEISIDPLSRFMYLVNTAFARFFNRKYERSGPVFGSRYKSVPIFSGLQFWDTLRYIFYNPVAAGLSKDIYSYLWSSCGTQTFHSIPITPPPEFQLAEDFKSFIRKMPPEGVRYLEPNEAISDGRAAKLIVEKEKLTSSFDVANLPADIQTKVLKRAWAMGISVQRLVRITGLSKGMIERRLKTCDAA